MHDRGSRLVLQKAHLSFGALQAAPPAARSLPMRALRQAPLPGACPASARRHDLAMPFLRLWGAAGHPGSSGGPLARVMPARALAGWAPAPRPAPATAGILGALRRLARHRPAYAAPALCSETGELFPAAS